MVFASVLDETPYYLAVPDDGSGLLKGLLDQNSCFKKHMENSDVDHLLVDYLQPIKVWNDYILVLIFRAWFFLMHYIVGGVL